MHDFIKLTEDSFLALVDAVIQQYDVTYAPLIAESGQGTATLKWKLIKGSKQLLVGYSDKQAPGRYELSKTSGKKTRFSYAVGADSPKKYFFKPKQNLWKVTDYPHNPELQVFEESRQTKAFIGLRPCDLKAIQTQDRVFGLKSTSSERDPYYVQQRESVFLVGISCTHPSDACFCTSFNYGPFFSGNERDLDLEVVEVEKPEGVEYWVRPYSEPARKLIADLDSSMCTESDKKHLKAINESAIGRIKKSLDYSHVKETLPSLLNSNKWSDFDNKCLSCSNCTTVCPTCFCSDINDSTDLAGSESVRERKWDSCFNPSHSYMHGGLVKADTSARYKLWLTHKLTSWEDQFGVPGCVGCGRCVSWCPVGIDITAEAESICKA